MLSDSARTYLLLCLSPSRYPRAVGMTVALAFAATMPYVVIAVGRFVLRQKKPLTEWPAISLELARAVTVMSGSSFASLVGTCHYKR